MHTGRYRKIPRNLVRCDFCHSVIQSWPKHGVILENETGTESKKMHLSCAERFIKLHGAKVIGDNVGRDS